jgi:hypothetical protein
MQADPVLTWGAVVVLAGVIAVALLKVAKTRLSLVGKSKPLGKMPEGLQFYANPTAHEPPGTIFRIDADRTRYLVKPVPVKVQAAPESSGRWRETVTASTGVLAQLLGVAPATLKIGSERTEEMVFEVSGLIREITYDSDLESVLDTFRKEFKFRADNQYFIIRECWSAKSIDYCFSEKYIQDLGGEAVVKSVVAKGTLFTHRRTGDYVLKKKFEVPMRVLFLPEAIKPVSAALGRDLPRLDRIPVTKPLVWESEKS